MNAQFETLAAAALKLAPHEREAFVQLLLASLDGDPVEADHLAAEVARRDAEIEAGAAKAIPVDEAIATIRASLK